MQGRFEPSLTRCNKVALYGPNAMPDRALPRFVETVAIRAPVDNAFPRFTCYRRSNRLNIAGPARD